MRAPADLNSPASLRRFRRKLLTWYRSCQRPLPWRDSGDPYRIWVSEIMLQQTRVAAVLEPYQRFLRSFPTLGHLAAADEAEVLAVWSGLGYYRRARMLHRAAKLVVASSAGRIPGTSTQLGMLPGIGRYTANAIASIAFGEPVSTVDGNVGRVLARLLGKAVSGEQLWKAAQTLLDPDAPGDFNQAMMELGATVCVPVAPLCHLCPVKGECASRGMERGPASISKPRLRRSSSLLLVRRPNVILLRQRGPTERLMPGMWELPEASGQIGGEPLLRVQHSITTTDWRVSVFVRSQPPACPRERWIPISEICRLPLTGLTRKIFQKLKLLA